MHTHIYTNVNLYFSYYCENLALWKILFIFNSQVTTQEKQPSLSWYFILRGHSKGKAK
ncbi:hypothetical protein [Plasmodium yoelii yoelii]|uniref:Uncharacterized protein n=1 Tax=Plasmodium yoelii yoelii TaxID=73239 RepID=Q7RQQ5_PLAYO|nr:hypothetical protein [Plasmodium yoelii yoelii]